jgi:hypothetical protein
MGRRTSSGPRRRAVRTRMRMPTARLWVWDFIYVRFGECVARPRNSAACRAGARAAMPGRARVSCTGHVSTACRGSHGQATQAARTRREEEDEGLLTYTCRRRPTRRVRTTSAPGKRTASTATPCVHHERGSKIRRRRLRGEVEAWHGDAASWAGAVKRLGRGQLGEVGGHGAERLSGEGLGGFWEDEQGLLRAVEGDRGRVNSWRVRLAERPRSRAPHGQAPLRLRASCCCMRLGERRLRLRVASVLGARWDMARDGWASARASGGAGRGTRRHWASALRALGRGTRVGRGGMRASALGRRPRLGSGSVRARVWGRGGCALVGRGGWAGMHGSWAARARQAARELGRGRQGRKGFFLFIFFLFT